MYFLTLIVALATLAGAHKKVSTGANEKVAVHPDKVGKLPLVDFHLNFNHYSGYLDSINGIKHHYWFFESQNKPETDPVVVWLNGGPGYDFQIF